ncbi:MAG: cytochrome b/b6 domain-containing protein [Gammaproteobacteria bacterium]|nr:cytochrome b/b6 domain-containing protein [Gammaproteobacteria bacterium]
MSELKVYPVWDAGTRWFHWINVLCVLALAGIGLTILNAGGLGVTNDGKAALKTLHVWVGYVFALNLLWRFAWAFLGNRYARWRAILPGGRGYFEALRRYVAAFRAGRPEPYVGHNPAGRLGVAVLLLLLAVMALTGLVLAGTDLFYPPLGHWIAQWVAAPGVDPATLKPYAPAMYDEAIYKEMRAWRKPFGSVHLYGFYALLVVVVVHVASVIATEVKEGGNLISALFTGRKILGGRPVDDVRDRNG